MKPIKRRHTKTALDVLKRDIARGFNHFTAQLGRTHLRHFSDLRFRH